MPKCQGIDGQCPEKKNDKYVKKIDDMMLCPSCVVTKNAEDRLNDMQSFNGSANRRDIILDPLLGYMHYALQSGTVDKVKDAVLGFFSLEAITKAKLALFDNCDASLIGTYKQHRTGTNRSEGEAHVLDIISALKQLDDNQQMPIIAIPSTDLRAIPRSHPEELNTISMVDRLNQMEEKMRQVQQCMDNTIAQNMALGDRVMTLENTRSSYSSVLSSSAPIPASAPPAPNTSRHLPASEMRADNRRQDERPPTRLAVPITIQRHDSISNVSEHSNISETSGYQYQSHYKKKLQRRNNIITGSNQRAGNQSTTGFRGAPEPDRHLFIYRVENDVSVDSLEDWLKRNDITYRTISCISNDQAKFKSFKLTVSVTQFKQLFVANLWPNGVRVRPFRQKNTIHDG